MRRLVLERYATKRSKAAAARSGARASCSRSSRKNRKPWRAHCRS